MAQPADVKVVFFGNERLSTAFETDAPTLRGLIAAGYHVEAVVSHHSESRSRSGRSLEIATVAAEHNIPVFLPEKPAEIIDELRALKPDIGVLVAYGKIVPQSVIDVFPHGVINIHPSLLPLHRGPIPIESAILGGETETGVSVMGLVRAMDAGPVYKQARLPLSGSETKQELTQKLLELGGQLVLEILPGIIDGSCQPTVQNDADATYDDLITKADGVLDFTKPAARLEREVRAYLGWPGTRTRISGIDSIITSAHVGQTPASADSEAQNAAIQNTVQLGAIWRAGKQFGFHTSNGVLVVDRLKPAGKQDMSAEAFLAGYGKDL